MKSVPEGRTSVAFLLPSLAAGGMERVTLTVAHELAMSQHFSVDLVLEKREGAFLSDLPSEIGLFSLTRGAKWRAYAALIKACPGDGFDQLLRMVRDGDYVPLRRLCALADYLRRAKPVVLFVAHGRMPVLALWARAIAGVDTRVIIVEHSTLSRWLEVFSDEPARHRQWQYRVALARRLYPQADAIVAVSNGVADDLAATLSLPRDSITTIYNPVVGPAMLRAAEDPVTHPWFGDGEPPVVLAVGRLVREKNFSALINAFASMRHRRAARLLILGEGEERISLEAQIAALGLSEDVLLPGWADNPYAFMRQSDVFVLCSLFEGLGIVLAEAMACGCPVVAVDCPSGPREVLDEGRYGRLVPLHDTRALTDAIQATLDESCEVEALRSRAEVFSVARGVAAYRALIDRLIGPESTAEPADG